MQTNDPRKPNALLALLLAFSLVPSAFADLSAVVQPGYVFGPNERPSTSTLNRLGNPTITITGTIGGTNASVAAGSINGTHLSDTIVDGTNITFNGASPRALTIVNAGVDVTQISTNIAGNGLGGGSGTNLFIKLDTNATPGLSIVSDMLVLSNVPPHRLNVTSNYVIVGTTNDTGLAVPIPTFANVLATNLGFTSIEYALATGLVANTNHGLAATPSQVRWVLVCKTNDASYAVGDEIAALFGDGEASTYSVGVIWGANSTNVFVTIQSTTFNLMDKSTGSFTAATAARWRLKCYAKP